MHHTIEERQFFPKLAKKIPKFSPTYEDEGHIKAHKAIHEGLVSLGRLVRKWREQPSTYSPTELRACLDSFSGVLFQHLDQEVSPLESYFEKKQTLDDLS
jgi:hemerythrin-like domain-containing protein